MEILIGSGDYIVNGITKGAVNGVQIRLLKNHGKKIDTNVNDVVADATELCTILFKDLKAGRLFQDQVNVACMRMNGYKVENV